MRTTESLRRFAVILALASVCAAECRAITLLFAEDFEGGTLVTSPTYALPNAWSPVPPAGWVVQSQLPGIGDPQIGVTEFEGWTRWRKSFWQSDPVTGDLQRERNRRPRFERGTGVIAVADPDTWDSRGQAARRGLYNTLLRTPEIDLGAVLADERRLVLGFDTSWSGGCCNTTGPVSNQTAIVRARFNGGPIVELLRWESAPFFDSQGRPTLLPMSPTGAPNTPNPRFFPRDFDDRVFLDFSALLGPSFAQLGEGLAPSGAALADGATSGDASSGDASSGDTVEIEFAMEDAGDDGWWAIDNVEFESFQAPIPGDLHIDGVLDALDIDAFALGLLDEEAYEDAWAGESPVLRGSVNSVFDFDDIPWFLGVMKNAGVPEPAAALALALAPVPEPAAGLLAALAVCAACPRRGRGR